MTYESSHQANLSTATTVAVSIELAARIFQKIEGGLLADNINDTPLNKQSIATLIGAKLNIALLANAEKVQ